MFVPDKIRVFPSEMSIVYSNLTTKALICYKLKYIKVISYVGRKINLQKEARLPDQ